MNININDNKFKVKIVSTSDEISQGMMGKKFDENYDGMLFLMDDETHHFWMKNCIIPLDIIFIKDGRICKIYHNCPPCYTKDCEHYEGYGDLVLELDGGKCKSLGIKIGDFVRFS